MRIAHAELIGDGDHFRVWITSRAWCFRVGCFRVWVFKSRPGRSVLRPLEFGFLLDRITFFSAKVFIALAFSLRNNLVV
jgi:hypothetical protein